MVTNTKGLEFGILMAAQGESAGSDLSLHSTRRVVLFLDLLFTSLCFSVFLY